MKLHLGENIRENRRRMGLTQEQLADRLGVSFQSVSRWENGTTYPDMELLPEIARLFDTTVDILLGYGEKEEKKPLEDVQNEFLEACGREDWDECVRVLRRIRHEYIDEMREARFLHDANALTMGEGGINPAVMDEIRLLVDAYFQRGTNGQTRADMVRFMSDIEDDDKIGDFLGKYATGFVDLQTRTLLEHRYHLKQNWDKYHEYFYPMKFKQLQDFFFPPCALCEASDPEHWCRVSETKLDVLHSLCRTEPDEKHPISGNGEVDIFVCIRLSIAEDYVTQLCGCGEYERAFLVMEDMAGLLEKLIGMPNGTIVPNPCPMLFGLVLEKRAGWNAAEERIGYISLDPVRENGKFDPLAWFTCDSLFTTRAVFWFTKGDFRNERMDTKWLDPVREHPRYKEAVRRMDECTIGGKQENDYGYSETHVSEAYNKGRKAIGKKVMERSH